jgi:endonuclease/exonuclease/phosphatase family metal-dependent hydrolase
LLFAGVVAMWGSWRGWRSGAPRQPFVWREAAAAVWSAKWELLTPAVILTSMFGGYTSLVESAALTVIYALIVEVLIHRDIHIFRDVPRIAIECVTLVGGFLIILGVAQALATYLSLAEIPDQLLQWVQATIHSRGVFLLALNAFLIIVGAIGETFSAIFVLVPLIAPMARYYGIDPIHLGVIFIANMELGYLIPPMGANLFLSSYRFNKPLIEIWKSTLPYLALLLAVLMLVTYIPAITLSPVIWAGNYTKTRLERKTMHRRLSFVLSCTLLLNLAAASVHAAADKRDVTVMTRNMDAGTDLQWFFAVDVPTAATLTLAEVIASNYPARAGLLADEIGAEAPDLIGLQEVSLIQATQPGQPDIVLDQLQLLLKALGARNLNYAAVAVNTLTTVTVPTSTGQLVRYTDQDVVLARTDLQQSELALSNIQEHIYAAKLNFPIGGQMLPVLRGYISVDAKVRGKTFRFIDTHMENLAPGVPPDAFQPQLAQAYELLDFVRGTALPVVLAGDFNCNAEKGPDHGAATDAIVASGFTDTWRVFNPKGSGFTWPLFLEDFNSGASVIPFERIDLIFARYLNVLEVHRTGLNSPWPSDHAGVVSTVQLVP